MAPVGSPARRPSLAQNEDEDENENERPRGKL
jgi:hypothetical protein